MKKMAFVLLIGLILSLTLFTLALASPSPYQLERSVIASAGGEISSSGYTMNSTLGQAIIGKKSSANYQMGSGYWPRVVVQYLLRLPIILKNFLP